MHTAVNVVLWIVIGLCCICIGLMNWAIYEDARAKGYTLRSLYCLFRNVTMLKRVSWMGRMCGRLGIAYSFQCGFCKQRFPCSNAWNHMTWCSRQLREKVVTE